VSPQLRRRIASIALIIGFFVAWELLCVAFGVKDIVLPRPSQIVITLVERLPAIWPHALQTLYTTLVGFASGLGMAVPAVSVRLPNLEHGIRHELGLRIEHTDHELNVIALGIGRRNSCERSVGRQADGEKWADSLRAGGNPGAVVLHRLTPAPRTASRNGLAARYPI